MNFHEALEAALKREDPVLQVRGLAQRLFDAGLDRATIVDMFERARQPLQQASREADEDVLLDVMDFITGWCSPHMKLPENQPTGFTWTYPVYAMKVGQDWAGIHGKTPDGSEIEAIVLFTDLDLAERYAAQHRLEGTIHELRSPLELAALLQTVLPPTLAVAFDPSGTPGRLAKACVRISSMLEKYLPWRSTVEEKDECIPVGASAC